MPDVSKGDTGVFRSLINKCHSAFLYINHPKIGVRIAFSLALLGCKCVLFAFSWRFLELRELLGHMVQRK